MKRMLLALLLLSGVINSYVFAQTAQFYLHIPDKSIITNVVTVGNTVTPEFSDPDINEIIGGYEITGFRKAFPYSWQEYLQQLYLVECDSIKLAYDLKAFDSQLFPSFERVYPAVPTAYIPNDLHDYSDGYLDFINATNAWGITKGDSNIIIGVSDTYFDMNNLDLAPKIAHLGANVQPIDDAYHGTLVAGLVAGATDNNIGYPAIGFKCKLDVSNNTGVSELQAMSLYRNRKVINASWGVYQQYHVDTLNLPMYFSTESALNEVYENGTTVCYGAGNGRPQVEVTPRTFQYPASLDHSISVSGVGWENTNPPYTFNVIDIHDINIGDSVGTHQHNTRIDICAPSVRVGGLLFDPTDSSKHYGWSQGWGTSFASPIVAGTCGLMLSANWSLTPYQIEWLLKKTARDIYSNTPNMKYAFGPTRFTGRLGAGALDAGVAVYEAERLKEYNPGIKTFKIKGVDVNTRCAPGIYAGVPNPKLKVLLEGGTPPYTYKWEPLGTNNAVLSIATTPDSPTVVSTTGNHLLYYRLTVYDASDIQKVASKFIKIQFRVDSTWDLVMRDGYADMFNERNNMDSINFKHWNIWESPDLWNRDSNDKVTIHENPEYDAFKPNYLYTRIKNVGCAVSPVDPDHIKLNLYWTIASTGETWDMDWIGTGAPVNGQPCGAIITGGGSSIPSIKSGDEYIIETAWTPPNPQSYDTAAEIKVCVLARIEQPGANLGMTFPEDSVTKENVWNNNNIVTRNLIVQNYSANKMSTTTLVGFGNSTNTPKVFTLQVLTAKHLEPYLEGALSKYFTVTLHLGDLFNVWEAGGRQGNPTSFDDMAKTVSYNLEQPLRLDNIELAGLEKHYIRVTISLKEGITVPFEIANERLYVRQVIPYEAEVDNGDGTTFPMQRDEVYGSVNFDINVEADEEGSDGDSKQGNNIVPIERKPDFLVYPNPVKNFLTVMSLTNDTKSKADISIVDVSGKVVIEQSDVVFERNMHRISTSELVPGVYFIRIADKAGKSYSMKFVKTN